MKSWLLLFFLFSFLPANSQIDSADITPHAGDQYIIEKADNFGGSISSGMNQIWDFSSLITPTWVDTISCKAVDTNFVVIGGVGKLDDVQLEHSSTNYIEHLGLFSDRIQLEAYFVGTNVIGTQKQKFYEFPISYGNTYQSQFKFVPTGEPMVQRRNIRMVL